MALKAIVETLEGLPDAVKVEYEQKDGKFVLKVDGAEDAFASGLKKNRDELLDQKKQVDAKLKAFEGLGLTPEKIKELAEAQVKAEEENNKAAGNWDTLKNTLNTQHASQLAAKDTEITGLTATVESLMVDSVAVSAVAEEKGEALLLLPHIKSHTKVVKADGKFVVQVLDDKGQPRIAGDGSGNPMTIKQLVAEMKADAKFGRAFDGSGASGSGAPNKSNAGGAGNVKSKAALGTAKNKSDFIDQYGLEAFKALPDK